MSETDERKKRPVINNDRLWSDLQEVGKIGFEKGRGVNRPALSDADVTAKNWLMDRMQEAGLEIRVDAATNVIGTLRTSAKRPAKILIVGSHLDTVPNGGVFDGALGIAAALECARTIRENSIELPWDLEVINFSDEEAAYNAGTIGSRAMIGQLKEGEIYISKAKGLSTYAKEMEKMDKDPARITEAGRDPKIFEAVLELHIEQGKRLEAENLKIGAVTGISGIYRYIVAVDGEAGHAGTTPMHLRDDALIKAAPVFTLLPQWVRARNKEMVGTIGQVTLEPGATNVIPGRCEFIVEVRSMLASDMAAIRELLQEWAHSQTGVSIKTIYEKDSVDLTPSLVDAVVRSAEAEGMSNVRMASGAGHDTQSFAPYVPCGMIFIPCRDGKSHCPEEWIEPEQAADGCQVLLGTILDLAQRKK
jgi:hydantoinase/carbamoylase family amidase